MLKLKKKHQPDKKKRRPPADGRRLVAEQSVSRAVLGSLAVALLLCWGWAIASATINKVFPWITIVMGALIGMAVQRFGRGLDWRFPVIAMAVSLFAAYFGNLLIGVVETGQYIEEPVLRVLGGLSADTMRLFFRNTISPVDHIYALSAAGVAAFFANRRLQRHEVLGLRIMKKDSQ